MIVAENRKDERLNREAARPASRDPRNAATQEAAGDDRVDALRRAGEAGLEVLRRAGETARDAARCSALAGLESGRQLIEDAAGQVEEVGRQIAEAMQEAAEAMSRLSALRASADGGLQEMQRAMAGILDGMAETNLRMTGELCRLTSLGSVLELQRRLAREYLDALLKGQAAILHAAGRIADEAVRPLEEWTEARRRAYGEQLAVGVAG